MITNLRHRPERLYRAIYCARGDSEHRLKELHHDLAVGRTSGSRFWANQLRVTLTAEAYGCCKNSSSAPTTRRSPARTSAVCVSSC